MSTATISDERCDTNAFRSAVNHLALGQLETVLAILRGGLQKENESVDTCEPSHDSEYVCSSAENILALIASFMKRYGGPGATVDRALPSAATGSLPLLHASFRVAASSIAPCVEAMVFAVANTPWASEVTVWWDDELVVLIHVLVHQLANMLHRTTAIHNRPRNVAAMRSELLRSFEFLFEHDPEGFGDLDFRLFADIVLSVDKIWKSGVACTAALGEGEAVEVPVSFAAMPAVFDIFLESIWALTRCYFSIDSYQCWFEQVAHEWEDHSDGSSQQPICPVLVLRVLRVCRSPPPDPIQSKFHADTMADVRRQRTQAALLRRRAAAPHDETSLTFSRASYIRATTFDSTSIRLVGAMPSASTTGASPSAHPVPSSLFCSTFCRTYAMRDPLTPPSVSPFPFRSSLLDCCTKYEELHRFADAFVAYDQRCRGADSSSFAHAQLHNTGIPFHDRNALHEFTSALLLNGGTNDGAPCDALSCHLRCVIGFLTTGACPSIAGTGGTSSRQQQSLFSTLRSFFPSTALEVLKPFACFELYAQPASRAQFRTTPLKLSLSDHELLLEYFSTSDGSQSLLDDDHPCRPTIEGVRLCVRVATLFQQLSTTETSGRATQVSPDAGHLLVMDLLDSSCDVLTPLRRMAATATEEDQTMQLTQKLIALLTEYSFATNSGQLRLTPRLTKRVDRQVLLLRAVTLLQFVIRNVSNRPDGSEGGFDASGFESAVQQYGAAAGSPLVAADGTCHALTELVVEAVVSLTAQSHLSSLLPTSPTSSSDKESCSASSWSTPAKRRTTTTDCTPLSKDPGSSRRGGTASVNETADGDQERGLLTFCSVVTTLKHHLPKDLLSDEVRSFLQDIVFRASRGVRAKSCSPNAVQLNAFARSPYRYLLDAALSPTATSEIEDVLAQLFVRRGQVADVVASSRVHPVLLFTFLSTRLRAVRSGSLTLCEFMAHLEMLQAVLQVSTGEQPAVATASSSLPRLRSLSVHNRLSADQALLRVEELWFHSPMSVAALLESDSSFVKTYQQAAIVSDSANSDIRAISKRFEAVMKTLGQNSEGQAGSQASLHDGDHSAFARYLVATDDVRCSHKLLEVHLKAVDRMSRVACSSAANAEDLIPILQSVSGLLDCGDAASVWVPLFSVPVSTPVRVSDVILRVKALSDAVRQYGNVQASLPMVVQQGHDLLFTSAVTGALLRGLASNELQVTKSSSNLLLRIILTEFYLRSPSAASTLDDQLESRKPQLSAEEEGNLVALLSHMVTPSAGLLFLYLFCSSRAIESAEAQSKEAPTTTKLSWLQAWLSEAWSLMQTLQRCTHASQQPQDVHSADHRPMRRAQFIFSRSAQLQATSEVLVALSSENGRDDRALLDLCEAVSLAHLQASLSSVSLQASAVTVRDSLLDVLVRQIAALRGQQVALATQAQRTASGSVRPILIPERWYHAVEELVMAMPLSKHTLMLLVPEARDQKAAASFSLHALLPYQSQQRLLQHYAKRAAMECHIDPEDGELRDLAQLIGQRLGQIKLCNDFMDSMAELSKRSSAAQGVNIGASVRLLFLDPLPLEMCVTSFRTTDDELRLLGDSCGLSKHTTLHMRTQHLALVRSNLVGGGDSALLTDVVAQLAARYSDYLRHVHETQSAVASSAKADFAFMCELSRCIKSESATSPSTAGVLIQRVVELLLNASDVSMQLAFRIVRFVTESSMTKQLFSSAKWCGIAIGMQVLHALAAYDSEVEADDESIHQQNTPTSPASEKELLRAASSAKLSASRADVSVPISCHFDRSFIAHPLLVMENMLMSQRLSVVCPMVHLLSSSGDAALRQQCDALLMRYAKLAVETSHLLSSTGEKVFPYDNRLTEEPERIVPPLHPGRFGGLQLLPDLSPEAMAAKRKQFAFPAGSTPNIPLFRRLCCLMSSRIVADAFVTDLAMAMFDSIGDYESHTSRILVIDTIEQVLHSSPIDDDDADGDENLRQKLLHWLQISRHLVVSKWAAHPTRSDLENEAGVKELVTQLLEHGHNNGAFSIGEACDMDIRMIHSLWVSRTTHLLNLGLFEEAANTLSTLPGERVKEILTSVLETIECTPIPIGYRATVRQGSYSVKPPPPTTQLGSTGTADVAAANAAIAAEVQSMMTLRRIGVRSLLSRFGSHGDVMAYCVRSLDFAQAFPIAVQVKKDEDVLLRDLYLPVEHMQCVDAFRRGMLQFDSTLERLRFLLIIICKNLESRQEYAQLLSWQEFMCDYARAAQTSILLAVAPSDSATYAQRVALLAKAEKYFMEAKFQPASKQAPAQHSEEGIILPPTRLDAQALTASLMHCRIQKDLWSLLHSHSSTMDCAKFSLYGEADQVAKVLSDALMLGKAFFEVSTKILTNLGVSVQHVFAPTSLQLLRGKKHDVVEQLIDFYRKCMLLGPVERNGILLEIFRGCHSDANSSSSTNPKKALKLCDSCIDQMTADGGYKARALIVLRRWVDALNEAFASKEKSVILELYEKVSAVQPQDDETQHVANTSRQYLARNNLRV